jgi:hypothetical protein
MAFEHLNRVLDEALQGLPNIEKKKKEGLVFTHWPELVGKPLSEHTVAEFVRGGILYVRVSDSIRMYELHYQKPAIINQIEKEIGEGIIKDIILRMGEITLTRAKARGEGTPGIRRISKKKKEEIQKVLSVINDLELKEALRRIFTKAARLKR